MKFATPIGAFFGNNAQVNLPAVVSMIASGAGAAALAEVAGFLGADDVVGFVCETADIETSATIATMNLRM
jgi:hypothetical protein